MLYLAKRRRLLELDVMETVPKPEGEKNRVIIRLRKLLVVLGALLLVLGLLFVGPGRAHLGLGRLRTIRKYASRLSHRRLQFEGKVPKRE